MLFYAHYNNNIHILFFPKALNNTVHRHFTRISVNFHFNTVLSLDKRDFIYHYTVNWNKCSTDIKALPKPLFLCGCKLHIIYIHTYIHTYIHIYIYI